MTPDRRTQEERAHRSHDDADTDGPDPVDDEQMTLSRDEAARVEERRERDR